MEDLKLLASDISEIKSLTVELVKQGAVHNQILAEHEKRSTSLEARLGPIEDDHVFYRKLVVLGGGLLGLLTFVLEALRMIEGFGKH